MTNGSIKCIRRPALRIWFSESRVYGVGGEWLSFHAFTYLYPSCQETKISGKAAYKTIDELDKAVDDLKLKIKEKSLIKTQNGVIDVDQGNNTKVQPATMKRGVGESKSCLPSGIFDGVNHEELQQCKSCFQINPEIILWGVDSQKLQLAGAHSLVSLTRCVRLL